MLRTAAGVAAGLSSLAFLGIAVPANAQQDQQRQDQPRRVIRQGDGPRDGGPRMGRRGGPGMRFGGGGDRGFGPRAEQPPVTAEELTTYADILDLDPSQRDVLAQMHAELMDTVARLQGERETKLDEIRQKFQENKDPTVFMEEMPKFMQSMRERQEAAEKTFFDDLQLLLSPEQEAHWPKMERTRRRERTLSPGMVPGDAVDLIALSKEMGFAQRDGVAPLLDTYELDLDQKLQAREAARPFSSGGPGPGMMQFNPDEIAKNMEKMRDAAMALRDLNQKYVRLVGEMLPTDEREALAAKVHEASFPQVYRENRTRRAFDMALGMDDLDADQRARIESLYSDFNKKASALNKSWADALEKEALAGGGGGRMSFRTAGGAQIELAEGGGEESEASQARQARRDADNEMYNALRGILRPEQQERMPKRWGAEPDGAEGNMVFMSQDFVDAGDGAVGQRVMVIEMDEGGEGVGEDVEVNIHAVGGEDGEMVIIHEETTPQEGGAKDEQPKKKDGEGGQ
ncbi:MAG: hypothetical protein KDA20_04310 [Phycisphaerales bacterium]|nr:hypothetical protein [Phycisphaerales bacterium]